MKLSVIMSMLYSQVQSCLTKRQAQNFSLCTTLTPMTSLDGFQSRTTQCKSCFNHGALQLQEMRKSNGSRGKVQYYYHTYGHGALQLQRSHWLVDNFSIQQHAGLFLKNNRHRAPAVWRLFSKNRFEHFVIVDKSKQVFNSQTFPFLADTKLHVHVVCIKRDCLSK